MFKFKFLLFLIISGSTIAQTTSEPIFFIGPMIHYNIGGGDKKFSFALEASAWLLNQNLPLPIGGDLGVEFQRKKVRVYSELQTGSLLGLSLGPVVEFSENDPVLGFQSSLWSAFFLGFDMRYRRINKSNYYSPGIFFKLPLSMDNLSFGF